MQAKHLRWKAFIDHSRQSGWYALQKPPLYLPTASRHCFRCNEGLSTGSQGLPDFSGQLTNQVILSDNDHPQCH